MEGYKAGLQEGKDRMIATGEVLTKIEQAQAELEVAAHEDNEDARDALGLVGGA